LKQLNILRTEAVVVFAQYADTDLDLQPSEHDGVLSNGPELCFQ